MEFLRPLKEEIRALKHCFQAHSAKEGWRLRTLTRPYSVLLLKISDSFLLSSFSRAHAAQRADSAVRSLA